MIRMPTTVLVIYLFVCLTKVTVVSNQECRSVESISDFALFRHTYRQMSGTRIESCAAMCDADLLCYSFNYVVPAMTCELNNSSRRADSGNFLRRSGSFYLDKLKEPADYCVSLPCRNNGTCRTVRRHPGFECFCHDEFTGAKCEVCSSSPLGLANRQLPDENFNASSSVKPQKPSDARLHTNTSWVSEGANEFLQISFQPYSKLVTGVATQGNPHHYWFVTRYNLLYSSDGITWLYYQHEGQSDSRKVFEANQDSNTTITNQLQPPIRAMYLRIAPLYWQEKIALRVEIYGCNDHS